ncbi:MAG TPA: hypothetical protein VFG30_32155 [Polyangiales bacterium]|nr:hypothetical protein [Polyangiales bacterium]
MSDLQCPAKVLFVARDLLDLGASLLTPGNERYSGVFAASAIAADAGDLARATVLGQQAGCSLKILADVVDGTSLARAVQDLSDVYRGETIVVIADRDLMREVFGRAGGSMEPIAVSIDSSGWTMLKAADS